MLKVKKALISVSDKTGVIPLAKLLHSLGVEIISTGGTREALTKEGIPSSEISTITKNPEAFDGRVKTLSFATSAALLFDRERHYEEASSLKIQPIDLVVCNFYPFHIAKEKDLAIENLVDTIDIGGPTMVRSAAKNYKYVGVVTNPESYPKLIQELTTSGGSLSLETRMQLMCQAFNYTADYDALVSMAMDKKRGTRSLRLSFSEGKGLRYGENSHQQAYFYKERGPSQTLFDMHVHNGKELSFNNLMDVNSAIDSVRDLNRQGCAVIKHNTPCGLAESDDQLHSLTHAWEGDPISAFGSVIAFNQSLTLETAQFFEIDNPDKSKRKFIEVIIAPGYSPAALAYLRQQKNLRVIEYPNSSEKVSIDLRYFKGSLLWQESDEQLFSELKPVTSLQPSSSDLPVMEFGIKAVRHVKSNAIVVVRGKEDGSFQMLGMGAGQPNRLVSVSLALGKCKENLRNEFCGKSEDFEAYFRKEIAKSILVSEAFFPFPDSVESCASYGVKTILQPGGSIRDNAVIEKAEELGMTMIFTGLRHFKH